MLTWAHAHLVMAPLIFIIGIRPLFASGNAGLWSWHWGGPGRWRCRQGREHPAQRSAEKRRENCYRKEIAAIMVALKIKVFEFDSSTIASQCATLCEMQSWVTPWLLICWQVFDGLNPRVERTPSPRSRIKRDPLEKRYFPSNLLQSKR